MGKIFVTSDTHFGHNRAFLFEPRGFENIEEHDEAIISRWNEIVGPDDTVYHLGDVMLNDNEHGMECLRRLNGNVKIIRGNHDSDTRWALYDTLPNVECIGWATMIKYKKFMIYLSHFPTNTTNLDSDPHLRAHVLNLFGHTHQKDNFRNDIPYFYHVGVDSHNCYPVLLDDVLEEMKQKNQECINMLQFVRCKDNSTIEYIGKDYRNLIF